jgi:hypothetical protein
MFDSNLVQNDFFYQTGGSNDELIKVFYLANFHMCS